MGRKKPKKSAKKAAAAAASRGVVGPDYIQVLTGSIASKSVSLVLCGESHRDAIDVTRARGGKIEEGWTTTDFVELTAEMVGKHGGIEGGDADKGARVACGMFKRNGKLLPLGKAKEWGRDAGNEFVDCIDYGHEMALLWVPSKDNDGAKGRSFLVELFLDDAEDEDKSKSHLPSDVVDLLNKMSNASERMNGAKSLSRAVRDMKDGGTLGFENDESHRKLLSWTDTDAEARQLNRRRLLGEDVSTFEYDELIRDRKAKRRSEENTWTWDDWLMEVKSKLARGDDAEGAAALHVVLESPIPPWEVELCRDFLPGFEFTQAADCIRCLSEDSSGSEVDDFDPASDGFGSYVDFVYRRLLEAERALRGIRGGQGTGDNHFLHCVDCRDLGCEQARVDDSLDEDWTGLLEPDEREKLLGSGAARAPDWNHSPEEVELDRLRASGILGNDDVDDQDGETDDGAPDRITYPSMESFFGQCTDIVYYTPNYKVAYGPFLGKCVRSFDAWNSFFAELFFGGTVDRALSMLDLSGDARSCLHVRSPVMKCWNAGTGEYEWSRREDEEGDLALPLFPMKCFLKARGSAPARTWSSSLFAELSRCGCEELRDMSIHARRWALDDVAKHCENPKLSDDEIGGGEWFLAYLRQCHREIYDDIDHSDATELLRKRCVAGDSGRHRIGDIDVPGCADGFRLIADGLEDKSEKPTLSNEAEVMAKILIDIYMSKLVDASTVVKMAQIISRATERKIAIVCYMGSVHTRAVSDFFTQSEYDFKRKIFCGKQDWGEEEGRLLHLPAELWNLSTLFE